jgi:hypothetical protein
VIQRTGRVVAIYSVFNAEKLIRNSMVSMLPFVDEYIVGDGRYEGFEYPGGEFNCRCGLKGVHDNSCDNTLKEVERFRSEWPDRPVRITMYPVMPEFDKRNKMFDGVALGDTCAIVDDDEVFYGLPTPIRDFASPSGPWTAYNGVSVICMKWKYSFDWFPRFFLKTEGLRHVQAIEGNFSYSWGDAAHEVFDNSAYVKLPGVRFVNLYGTADMRGYRERERDAARAAYNEKGLRCKLPTGQTSRLKTEAAPKAA